MVFEVFSFKRHPMVSRDSAPFVLLRTAINSLTTPRGYILPGETRAVCFPNVREERRFTLIVFSLPRLSLETHHSVHHILFSGLMSDYFASSGHLPPPTGSQEGTGVNKYTDCKGNYFAHVYTVYCIGMFLLQIAPKILSLL